MPGKSKSTSYSTTAVLLGMTVFEQKTKLGDVPLPIPKFVEVATDHLAAADFKRLEESTAGALDKFPVRTISWSGAVSTMAWDRTWPFRIRR